MSGSGVNSHFSLDMQGLQRLKQSAGRDPELGLEQATRQFEALFVQMMMKSMRDAVPDSGLTEGNQRQFYTSLLDQQLSQDVAGRGIGLAEQLLRQLGPRMQGGAADSGNQAEALIAGIPRGQPRVLTGSLAAVQPMAEPKAASEPVPARNAVITESPNLSSSDNKRNIPAHVQTFVERLEAPALAASRASGVPAELILAQAALETGWGRYEIATPDGGNSHNLFGIKAGGHWQGKTTEVGTHEYVRGERVAVSDSFRVYDSFEQAFTDYARLIGDNPRYAGVVAAPDAQQAAKALQAGGYATDPGYADKLVAVMKLMGPVSEELQLAQADSLPGGGRLDQIF
ncbi:flagellar assembly peptidoglycan hydrolase FlgJ [Oceanisphaera arctica]|uniref:Peptidoglycan hydrolase FlgJ n=1 Tax=Oceanisphaera arctica TaxID=641510 RepID=A0A2P5TMS6_9GAMM|nr:flagellar assembly peptidoglycan hydrolase FlgJ [Oceanisphaera arctica]PPL16760.1 flagellar rod assembly protein/muramidase FlgJ [Oceanisphaera arctica]GHA06027.1 flagellar rod assembly protein/muramidase FlgJ [Oceanisphaera arctica]